MKNTAARSWGRPLAVLAAGATVAALALVAPSSASAATSTGFTPTPQRLLDTRTGLGSGIPGAIGGLTTVTIPGAVPTGETAVLTVTVTGATGPGNVQVYPSDATAVPATSNVNFGPGTTAPDTVLVSTPANGKIDLVVNGSPAQLIVDLDGYLPTSAYTPLASARLADSRSGTGFTAGPVSGTQQLTLPSSVPTTAGLVALTVTATGARSAGNVVVYSGTKPLTSNVNFVPGRTQANLVLVHPTAGKVSFTVSGGPSDLVVDLDGFTPAGSSVTAAGPTRIADSRTATGVKKGPISGAVTLAVPGVPAGVSAVLLNVTATGAAGTGFVTVYPGGTAPTSSNVNFARGVTGANLVLVPVSSTGTVSLFVGGAAVNLVVDLSGYVTS
jgi:hypothetical protein